MAHHPSPPVYHASPLRHKEHREPSSPTDTHVARISHSPRSSPFSSSSSIRSDRSVHTHTSGPAHQVTIRASSSTPFDPTENLPSSWFLSSRAATARSLICGGEYREQCRRSHAYLIVAMVKRGGTRSRFPPPPVPVVTLDPAPLRCIPS